MKIRKYFGILLCLFAFLMVGVARLSALPTSNEIVQNVSTERTALSEGVEFYARKDLTAFNGDIETVKRPQNVQAIVVPKSSEAVDLVVWSKGSNDKWSAAKLRDTIEDFELRNPGYTVIAGVNGDFFDISDTYQPTNSMVSAGDVWKKDTYRANNVTNTVFGFKPDKSYIVGPMTTDNYMTLKVMDGKVVTNSFKIDHANDKVLPTDNTQVSLFYPNLDLDVDFTGYTVYVGEYDIYRVSKPSSGYVVTNPVGSFVKGRITEVRNDMGMVTAIDNGKFYVATKNAALADVLVPNAEVKCEYSLNGNWSDVTNAIGFGARLVQDGQLLTQGDSSVAPRTMLGVRADGSYVFMTVDGRQETKGAFGISYVEGGALLQQLDCVQGFNLDGGGSTISIIRDANGELQVMNWPSDGNERSLGNTILVVKRDPKIAITEVGTTTIKVAQLGEVVDGTIRNVQVKVYGGEYQMMTGNEFTFTDLDRDSDYIILYKYEIVDDFGRVIRSAENKLVTTTFGAGVPEIDKFRVSTKSGTSITFDYEITTDEVTDIQQKYIVYGQDQRKFDLDDLSGKATISDLTAGTEYEFKLVIEYALAGTDRTVVSQAYTYKPAAAVSTGCPTGANVTALYLTFVSFAAAGVFLVLRKRG